MFFKKCYLAKSPIHGIGLFAGEDIDEGEVIWLPSQKLSFIFKDEVLMSSLFPKEIEIIKHYGYRNKKTNLWHFSSEDSRYINHSENPNVSITPDNTNGIFAKVNIKKDEEITQDYKDFEKLRSF